MRDGVVVTSIDQQMMRKNVLFDVYWAPHVWGSFSLIYKAYIIRNPTPLFPRNVKIGDKGFQEFPVTDDTAGYNETR
jgi:hypothetical protein